MFVLKLFFIANIISTGRTRYINPYHTKTNETCNQLICDISSNISVCGIRNEKTRMRFKIFANECALLKYGCSVEDKDAYGLIKMEYCNRLASPDKDVIITRKRNFEHNLQMLSDPAINNDECVNNCVFLDKNLICGIKPEGEGYKIKLFKNKCELVNYNCYAQFPFIQTELFICEGALQIPSVHGKPNSNGAEILNTKHNKSFEYPKNIIVVDASMLGQIDDVNETIENFFASTHVLDLPIREIDKKYMKSRRMLLKHVGPVKVFQPWITIPKKIKTDYFHKPTLSTCYHKCPTQCPDTYSPVCGVPGILAREPSIMFQNHCYMDVAQCKMFWENKSSTAVSSSYIESSFLFCLGDQLNGMYRFLPLIKSLQHMGRLKKKGKFHYRMTNMKFFNNYAYKEPKLMG